MSAGDTEPGHDAGASLAALLVDGADSDAPLVHWRDRTWTRGEMVAAARRVADTVQSAGAREGIAVGALVPTAPVGVAVLFGIWLARAVAAPLNPRQPDPEIERLCADIAPMTLLRPSGAPDELDVVAAPRSGPARDYGADAALVMSTSGTTGPPKRVVLGHTSTYASIDSAVANIRGTAPGGEHSHTRATRSSMPNLVPVPLALWAGIYNMLFAFRVGAPIILLEPFDTQEFRRIVARHELRSTVLAPAMLTMLADDERITSLHPLRFVRSISSPLSPYEARRFHERFGVTVLNSYGQTELGGQIAGWNAKDAREFGEAKLGAVGRPLDGIDVEIRTAEGTILPRGTSGEIWVRSPFKMHGFAVADEDEEARLDASGFLRTGDIGRLDPDGFLWVEGRISDAINRGGLKVFPADVEEVLRRDPSVADVCVAGVPDRRLGEVPWAFVVLAPGADLDPRRLEARCRERLAPYAVPARFEAVPELPRNDVGKVLRRVLVEGVRSTS